MLSPDMMMAAPRPAIDFQRFSPKLQQLGLNAYEARTYLALIQQNRGKALEVAAQAQVPRQKIYEVLDSLVEKGFAAVTQEKTKLFSAVDPSLAIAHYVARRNRIIHDAWADQARLAGGLVEDLIASVPAGDAEAVPAPLRVVTVAQEANAYRQRLLLGVRTRYVELIRPPYDGAELLAQALPEARRRGVDCRVVVEAGALPGTEWERLQALNGQDVPVRESRTLPAQLTLADAEHGLLSIGEPPGVRTLLFSQPELGAVLQTLFEEQWR